jgi:hypothetical protein
MSSNQDPPELDFIVLTHDARRLAGVLTLSLLLAGCTNQVAGSPIGTGQLVDSNPTASAPTGSGSADPGPPPQTIPNMPKAADGSDISACYDGECVVELRAPVTIPMAPSTGIAQFTLVSVDNVDGAYLTGTTADGNGTLSAQVSAYPGAGSGTVILNGFTIEALATVDGVAVLHFSAPR